MSGSSVDTWRQPYFGHPSDELVRDRECNSYTRENSRSTTQGGSEIERGATFRCELDLSTVPVEITPVVLSGNALVNANSDTAYKKIPEIVVAPVEELRPLSTSKQSASMEAESYFLPRTNKSPDTSDKSGEMGPFASCCMEICDLSITSPSVNKHNGTEEAISSVRKKCEIPMAGVTAKCEIPDNPVSMVSVAEECKMSDSPVSMESRMHPNSLLPEPSQEHQQGATAALTVAVPTTSLGQQLTPEFAIPTASSVVVTTASLGHKSSPEFAIPDASSLHHYTHNQIDYVEAILAHASECKGCPLPQCSHMKEEIEHCLQHGVLKQYKICDRCTTICSICIHHFKVCPVSSCCFYLCQTLKARFKRRVNHVKPIDRIIFKGPRCSLQGGFVEDVHYSVLTPKVVGRGQNGNVCEVHLLQPLVHDAKQQMLGVCLKKCKYRVEEIEVIKILGLHRNIIETLLIVQSDDQMLVFMPRLSGSLCQWKELLHSREQNPSAQDLFIKAFDVTSGLVYLHGMGIVHRDIKAANLLLEVGQPHSVVKICDFGHAKCIGMSGLSPPCPNCGTQGFRAPEIVRSEPHGFKVDIYSFGVTLLNLALPFDWQVRWPDEKAKGSYILEYMPNIGRVIGQCCQNDVPVRPSALQLFSWLRQSLM